MNDISPRDYAQSGGSERVLRSNVLSPGGASGSVHPEPFTLMTLLTRILRHPWVLLFCVVAATATSVALALNSPRYFRAEVLVTQSRSEGSGGGQSANANLLGTISTVLGGSLFQSSNLGFLTEYMKSRTFLKAFIQAYNIKQFLFLDKWDIAQQRWKEGEEPTLEDAYVLFKSLLTVVPNPGSGIISVRIEWTDRERAAEWANILIRYINESFKKSAIEESEEKRSFLDQELGKTSYVEVRHALAGLYETEVKNAMMARVQNDYVFKVVDFAEVPKATDPVRPERRKIVMAGFLIGLF
ncbi:MAG: hypothetical protein HQL56_09350, partial [Magnetococcales bacterium]|nr:hypothetical protein [Magnetococcales bacterium]